MKPIPLPGIGDPQELMRRAHARGLIHFPPPPAPIEKVVFNVIPEGGELTLIEWAKLEANRTGVAVSAIYLRIKRGKYPNVKLRRVNRRLAFVVTKDT